MFTALALTGNPVQKDAAVFLTFIMCLLVVGICQEIFYRLIEAPSLLAAKITWDFMRS